MKRRVVVYGCAVWLALCLLAGLSPWSSPAYGQWRYPNKVLETVKKKKKNKKARKPPKPKASKGTEVIELSDGPLMERQGPGSHGKKLKKSDKHYQPELNSAKKLPLKLEKKPRQKKIFSGRRKVKPFEEVKPGTHHTDRGLGPSLKYLEQGTQSQGELRVKKSAVKEPGKGQEHSNKELRRHGRRQGTQNEGGLRIKRRFVKKPGTHHEDRSVGLSERYRSSTNAASYDGSRKIRQKELLEPGTLHSNRKESIGKKYSSYKAAKHEGNLRMKRKHVREPGIYHSERPKSWSKKYNSTIAASHEGKQKVRKNEILQPGTHHSERSERIGRKYSSYEGGRFAGYRKVKKNSILKPGTHHSERGTAISRKYESTAAANYAGPFRVKKKYLKEPGTHHSKRSKTLARQYNSTEGASFRGNIKALSRRQQARYYEKQSEKAHQFEGNIRIRTADRNMHPSAAARKNVVMRSRKQAERRRSLHRWWNKLWDREQPEVVKEKPPKARYDKGENEIWENSRDW